MEYEKEDAPASLYAGDFITPAVRLVRLLAEGGMGKVWIAEHRGLDARVVVKVMSPEMAARPDGRERFAREAAVAAAVKSPHAVQVFDHGLTASGVPYIVMELLEGRDLGAHILERGRLELDEVVTIFIQIGRALGRAHRAGIVHRDVKPENIFLCDTGGEGSGRKEIHAKLLDFGTAKRDLGATLEAGRAVANRTTAPGLIMGTPFYMSPEQSIGSQVDLRTDIWSLGVVAFEALTGERPFSGGSVGAITIAIHGPLPRPTSVRPELPAAIDDWFARACARLPDDRFPNVRAAVDAFIEALTGERAAATDLPTESVCLPLSKPSSVAPVAIAPLAATLPTPGSERRTTALAAGAVGALAAIAMAAIIMTSSRGSATSAPAPAAEPPAAAAALPPPPPRPETRDIPPPEEPEPSLPPEPVPGPKPVHHAHAAPAPLLPVKHVALSKPSVQTPAPAKAAKAKAPPHQDQANPDEDLIRLQNISAAKAEPEPAAVPPPPPTPATATPDQPPPLPPPSPSLGEDQKPSP